MKKKSSSWMKNNLVVACLILNNILLLTLVSFSWGVSWSIERNLSKTTGQISGKVKDLSQSTNNLSKDLENMKNSVTNLVDSLKNSGGELTNIKTSLQGVDSEGIKNGLNNLNDKIEKKIDDLNTVLKQLKNTGEEIGNKELTNIKTSLQGIKLKGVEDGLNNLNSEVRGKIDELKTTISDSFSEIKPDLTKLASLGKVATDLEKKISPKVENLVKNITDEISKLTEKIKSLEEEIYCPSCQSIKTDFKLPFERKRIFEEHEWKQFFKEGKLSLEGKIENLIICKGNIPLTTKNEIEKDSGWKGLGKKSVPEITKCELVQPPGIKIGARWKKFTLKEKNTCHNCQQKIELKNYNEYQESKEKIIDLLNSLS